MQQVTPLTSSKNTILNQRAFTLVEITLVIGIMLTLASIVIYSVGTLAEWKEGRSAGEDLKAVYIAQKGYLADHPAAIPSNFTANNLTKYLPGSLTAIPTAQSLEDQDLTLDFKTLPPVFKLGSTLYDPSDTEKDGLWDVGSL